MYRKAPPEPVFNKYNPR